MSDPSLHTAVAALDRALSARPSVDASAFSEAIRSVCAYRDRLRAELHAGGDGPEVQGRLKDSNVAITLLMAGRFSLGETPWKQIEGLRARLEAMR